MGFGFPKQERAGLIASDPVKHLPPVTADERYNWVVVRLTEIDREPREIVEDAWRMVILPRLAAEVLGPL